MARRKVKRVDDTRLTRVRAGRSRVATRLTQRAEKHRAAVVEQQVAEANAYQLSKSWRGRHSKAYKQVMQTGFKAKYWEGLSKDERDELAEEILRTAQGRVSALEKAQVQNISPAYQNLISGGDSTLQMYKTKGDMYEELDRAIDFLKSKTSSVKETKTKYRNFIEAVGDEILDALDAHNAGLRKKDQLKLTRKDKERLAKVFYRIINELKKQGSPDYATVAEVVIQELAKNPGISDDALFAIVVSKPRSALGFQNTAEKVTRTI